MTKFRMGLTTAMTAKLHRHVFATHNAHPYHVARSNAFHSHAEGLQRITFALFVFRVSFTPPPSSSLLFLGPLLPSLLIPPLPWSPPLIPPHPLVLGPLLTPTKRADADLDKTYDPKFYICAWILSILAPGLHMFQHNVDSRMLIIFILFFTCVVLIAMFPLISHTFRTKISISIQTSIIIPISRPYLNFLTKSEIKNYKLLKLLPRIKLY